MNVGFTDNTMSVADDKFHKPFFGGEDFGLCP